MKETTAPSKRSDKVYEIRICVKAVGHDEKDALRTLASIVKYEHQGSWLRYLEEQAKFVEVEGF
jgi:hypothetical protein